MPARADRSERAVLAVNPGSTSTKLALFRGETQVAATGATHHPEELRACPRLWDQLDFRRRIVEAFVADCGRAAARLDAVVGRGGLLRPLRSGVYEVDDAMIADLGSARFGEHASNLGAPLARDVARSRGCPAFIADPVVVDEMDEVARLSGLPELPRRSIFHALNQKSAAREVAARIGKPYEECRLIVAHLGGGISVGAHRDGRVVDVNNALDGDGPFSPERSGGLPAGALAELAASGRVSRDELRRRMVGGGGLVAYCGTNSLERARHAADGGDRVAGLVLEAMAYQVAQQIAMHGATLEGRVDRVVLTGGMAQEERFVASVSRRVAWIAPVEVVPGEREMVSLARAGIDALDGTRPVLRYGPDGGMP